MSSRNDNKEILSTLEEVISKLQQKESDRQKEVKTHQFTLFMFALSVVVNGIGIKYFTWCTTEIYEHDKKIELLKSQVSMLKEEVSKLSSQQQQVLNLLQSNKRQGGF